MPESSSKSKLITVMVALTVATIYLFYLDFTSYNKGLTFAILDIGQGDALFIESPTGKQILFDAGPPRKILGPISHVMSPFDKSIDVLVITNPDTDHIGGFFDIIKNYKVGLVLEPGTKNPSKTYENLEKYIKSKNIQNVKAEKGMHLDIGGGAYIDILFPDRDVVDWETNDGSVVAKLVYGETSIMLTGDSTALTEKILLDNYSSDVLDSDVLKVGHHGSRTSSSAEFIKAVSPKYGVISLAENNKYGHPHEETLKTLIESGADIFRTDLLGTIVMESDGITKKFSFEK